MKAAIGSAGHGRLQHTVRPLNGTCEHFFKRVSHPIQPDRGNATDTTPASSGQRCRNSGIAPISKSRRNERTVRRSGARTGSSQAGHEHGEHEPRHAHRHQRHAPAVGGLELSAEPDPHHAAERDARWPGSPSPPRGRARGNSPPPATAPRRRMPRRPRRPARRQRAAARTSLTKPLARVHALHSSHAGRDDAAPRAQIAQQRRTEAPPARTPRRRPSRASRAARRSGGGRA